MSKNEREFKKLGPRHDEITDLIHTCNARMRLAAILQERLEDLPEGGFFSWQAVETFARKLFRDTSDSGRFFPKTLEEKYQKDGEAPFGKPLLVGVSGGADSAFLFHLCQTFSEIEIFKPVICCHVNHKLRGKESDEDAQFCENLSKLTGQHFAGVEADELQVLAFKRQSSEGALREFRYSAFESQSLKLGSKVVALAHTLEDQVETILFRAFRGTSATGLRGIPCMRRHNNMLIVRPIIDVSRETIISLLKYLKLEWREDSTNTQIHYARNYIRAEIVRRIENEFPEFGERVENMRKLIAQDEEFLGMLAQSHLSEVEGKNSNTWNLKKLQEIPIALRRRMLAQALKKRSVELSYERLEKLVLMSVSDADLRDGEEVPSAVSLNEQWDFVRGREQLIFLDKKENEYQPPADPIPVRIPGMTLIPALNKALFVEVFDPREKLPKAFPPADSLEPFVSLEKVKGALEIRERQPGDCIQPFGMQEMVKLKKYLHTHKPDEELPAQGRQKLHVLACGEEVLWVPGVGLSEKLRVNGRPTHVIKLLDIAIGESTFC